MVGTDNKTRKPEDIDIPGIDKDKYIFCECKFRNELFDLPELNDLIKASSVFNNAKERHYYIFARSGYTEAVKAEAEKYDMKLITVNDMF